MKTKTVDELRKASLIAGLKLFGLPNPRYSTYNSKSQCLMEMERLGINPENYKGIQESHGELSSGLLWGECGVIKEKLSERIRSMTDEALENFLYIGTFEYVFYPYSPEKALKDYSDTFSILDPYLRDKDGKIYTYVGECDEIYVTEVDVDLYDAIKIYVDVAKSLERSGYYSQEEMADVLVSTLMDYGEEKWERVR